MGLRLVNSRILHRIPALCLLASHHAPVPLPRRDPHLPICYSGKLEREVLTALDAPQDHSPERTLLRRVQFFGSIERGLLAEGKTGAAWQADRAAAETLRGKKIAAHSDGRSITRVVDLDQDISPIPDARQLVRSTRETIERKSTELKSETRYVITSLGREERNAARLAQAIRGHLVGGEQEPLETRPLPVERGRLTSAQESQWWPSPRPIERSRPAAA